MKKAIEVTSFVVILVGSIAMGFIGRPVEMGLCIVAGSMSLAFLNIDKFSFIKGAGFEAKLREKIEAVIEKETEPMLVSDVDIEPQNIMNIDKEKRTVINALQHPNYTWRYFGGIKKETGLDGSVITDNLKWLIDNDYAVESIGEKGYIWNLTQKGRTLSAQIDFSGKQVKVKHGKHQ